MCEFTDRLNRQSVWLAILAIALGVWGLTDIRSRAKTDPQNLAAHRTDLTVYTVAGAAMFDGRDPYAVTNPRGWHYLYPPLLAILVSPLAMLDSQWQGVLWYAISILAAWGCYTESQRIWRWLRWSNTSGASGPLRKSTANSATKQASVAVPVGFFCFAGATVLLPALNCLQRGQVGIILTYLLFLGFRCVLTSRTLWPALIGGIVLALPIAIKVIPALPVVCLCLLLLAAAGLHHWDAPLTRRAVGISSGVAVGLLLFFFVIPSVLIGPTTNSKLLNTWVTNVMLNDNGKSDDDFSIHVKRNQSLTNALYRLGNWTAYAYAHAPDDRLFDAETPVDSQTHDITMPMDTVWLSRSVRMLQLGLLALLFGAGWNAARDDNAWAVAAVFALACLLMSAISPIFRGHYYVLWLPAAWIVPVYVWQYGSQRLAVVLSISACALTWIHYLLLPSAGRLGVLGLGATIWYIVATISVLRTKPIARGESVQTNPELRYAA